MTLQSAFIHHRFMVGYLVMTPGAHFRIDLQFYLSAGGREPSSRGCSPFAAVTKNGRTRIPHGLNALARSSCPARLHKHRSGLPPDDFASVELSGLQRLRRPCKYLGGWIRTAVLADADDSECCRAGVSFPRGPQRIASPWPTGHGRWPAVLHHPQAQCRAGRRCRITELPQQMDKVRPY